MNTSDLVALRLQTQRLTGPPFEAPEHVVSWLCAVQSQDYGPAKWSVAQRTVGVTDAELDRAVIDASREYIAAQRARPRDQQRIDDARAELDGLLAMRDG